MNATERVVARIFAEALEHEGLAELDDDIFSLGGDSVNAVRAALALEREFNVEVPTEQMEEGLSVRAMARWIDDAPAASPRVDPQ